MKQRGLNDDYQRNAVCHPCLPVLGLCLRCSLDWVLIMNETKTDKIVGWVGSVCGITGAVLLALNLPISGYGYLFFLVSSVALVAWSFKTGAKHNLTMQLCFCVINSIGVYNWLIK